MDSSKREAQNQLEAIKQSILDGRLTHGQICDALAEEIKKELQKSAEEVDIEYVLASQRLVASLHPKKAAQAESHAEHNFEAAPCQTAAGKALCSKRQKACHQVWFCGCLPVSGIGRGGYSAHQTADQCQLLTRS